MKTITKELLQESANKLMFNLKDNELDTLFEEFKIITKQMELLSTVEGIESVEPMVFPFDVVTSFLRDDVASDCLSQDEALKNATDVVDGQIRLPKVVG